MVPTNSDHIGGPPIFIITQHLPQATTIVPTTPATANVYAPLPQPLPQQQQRPNILPVSYGPPNPLFGGMEAVWHTEFQNLFSQFYMSNSHIWYLSPTPGPPSSGCWTAFFDSAKVRFCCQDCGHGWTSMKGRVAFWFYFSNIGNDGHIAFKLYGQKCQRCKTGNYENAMWYPEEVTKVMLNAYNRVGQTIYGYYQASYAKSRRPGKPRTPHNSDLCQACQDGICSERR